MIWGKEEQQIVLMVTETFVDSSVLGPSGLALTLQLNRTNPVAEVLPPLYCSK